MREHLGFLETSSLVVKVAAWFFLFFGVVSGVATLLGRVPGAKIADLLIRIINEIKKE